MRILYFIASLNHGGAELQILSLCKELKKIDERYSFLVVSVLDSLGLKSEFEKIGVPVETLDGDNNRFFQKIKIAKQFIRQFKPDIVHTHTVPADMFGTISAKLSGVKRIVSTGHTMPLSPTRYDYVARWVASFCCNDIISVSNSAKDYFVNHKMYPKRKITVIHNSSGTKLLPTNNRSFPRENEKINILQLGRISEPKGQIYLLEAIESLKNLSIHLKIYGAKGDAMNDVESFIEKNNMTNVEICDPVNDVQPLYDWAHIYAGTSLWEAFHMSALEAMMVGVPVILTDLTAHKELLHNNSDFPFIRIKDSRAIADAIMSIVQNPEQAKIKSLELQKNGQIFSQERMMERYHRFYYKMFH